jgi:predicted permease
MHWIRRLIWRIEGLFGNERVESELDEELRYHVQREIRAKIQEGMNPKEARRQALVEFGGVERTKEQVRDARGGRLLNDLVRDVRFALRSLRRTPIFTAVALVSLAIGVGANTAIFSVVNGVLLRSLDYPDADRLHFVTIARPDYSAPFSDADLLRGIEANDDLVSLAGWKRQQFTRMTDQGAEIISGAWVTSGAFEVFGVSPILGRSFTPDDDLTVVLSDRFWQAEFGGVREVVGETLDLDGMEYTIVGVMPPGFRMLGVREGGIWVPRRISEPPRRGPFHIWAVARLGSSGSQERFEQHMRRIEDRVREQYSEGTSEWMYRARPLKEVIVGRTRPTLLLLFAAVGCVLLIAVGNVTNLLLARGTAQQRGIALRSALGADRGRLVRQALTESAVLGLLGALLGIAIAWGCVEVFSAGASSFVPRMDEVTVDGRVLAFGLLVGLGAALAAGTLPALSVPCGKLSSVLSEGGWSKTTGARRGTVRRVLVVGQFSLASGVLIVSLLVVKGLVHLESADLGFDGNGVVMFRPSLPRDPYEDPESWDAFFAALEQRLQAIPGVTNVGYSSSLPPDRLAMTNNYVVQGEEPTTSERQPVAEWIAVSERYFETLGIQTLHGRTFKTSDRAGEQEVAVVNEAFVRRHFADRDPIGERLKSAGPSDPWMTIVGIVGDVAYAGGAAAGMSPTVYTPYRQSWRGSSPFVVVRSVGDQGSVLRQIRAQLTELEPRAPLLDDATMEELIGASTATERARSVLLSIMALLALIPAATGVFGVLSYHVRLRGPEMALRRALGAPNGQLVRTVMKEGTRLASMGVVIGIVLALAVSRGLTAFLYGVSPTDVTIYVGAGLALATVAVSACLVPSTHVLRLDPVTVLREE